MKKTLFALASLLVVSSCSAFKLPSLSLTTKTRSLGTVAISAALTGVCLDQLMKKDGIRRGDKDLRMGEWFLSKWCGAALTGLVSSAVNICAENQMPELKPLLAGISVNAVTDTINDSKLAHKVTDRVPVLSSVVGNKNVHTDFARRIIVQRLVEKLCKVRWGKVNQEPVALLSAS